MYHKHLSRTLTLMMSIHTIEKARVTLIGQITSDIEALGLSKRMKSFAEFIQTAFKHAMIIRCLQLK